MTISKKPDWHPQYYTMNECFEACGDDDVPFILNGFNSERMINKEFIESHPHSFGMLLSEYQSDKWQIKRAEPKVLSGEEWVDNLLSKDALREKEIEWIKYTFEEADKNGQLREWLRPEQVALRNFVERMRGDAASYRHDAAKVLENLKPPA